MPARFVALSISDAHTTTCKGGGSRSGRSNGFITNNKIPLAISNRRVVRDKQHREERMMEGGRGGERDTQRHREWHNGGVKVRWGMQLANLLISSILHCQAPPADVVCPPRWSNATWNARLSKSARHRREYASSAEWEA